MAHLAHKRKYWAQRYSSSAKGMYPEGLAARTIPTKCIQNPPLTVLDDLLTLASAALLLLPQISPRRT